MKKTLATLLVVALVASLCGVMFVSAEETNIALGKEVLNAGKRGSYYANLTDGVALDSLTYNAEDWFGFYWNPGMDLAGNEAQQTNAIDGIAKPTVDLGATASIDKVRVNVFDGCTSGITAPETITLKVSTDGETYTDVDVASMEWPEDGSTNVRWIEFALETPVDARYVQLEMKMRTTFVFINEIEVYEAAKAPVEPETPAAEPSVSAKVLDGKLAFDEAALAKLIDGNTAANATAFSDAGFVSFENKGFTHTDGVDAAVPATLELVVDLGSVQTITKITLNAFKDSNSMIALPDVMFYASLDGVNFYEMNSGKAVAPAADAAETATAAITADFSTRILANARYIKAVATFKNGWVFLSELNVTTTDAEGEDLGAGYAYVDSYMEGYCIGVYHPEDGELDLTQNGDGKMLKSAQLIKAKYNADKGAYEVIYSKVNPWPAGHEGTETLAEGEILVAISTQGNVGTDAFTGAKWIARGLKEGDLITLKDGVITFYPADGKLPSEDAPATGDAGVLVFAVLAVVAVAGVAVVSKAKKAL
ncbi:MAG: discoidin domain-containing protein [Clostridia bacterium]|nr:discoidin domain-containing protein [Clostridia bacterium]